MFPRFLKILIIFLVVLPITACPYDPYTDPDNDNPVETPPPPPSPSPSTSPCTESSGQFTTPDGVTHTGTISTCCTTTIDSSCPAPDSHVACTSNFTATDGSGVENSEESHQCIFLEVIETDWDVISLKGIQNPLPTSNAGFKCGYRVLTGNVPNIGRENFLRYQRFTETQTEVSSNPKVDPECSQKTICNKLVSPYSYEENGVPKTIEMEPAWVSNTLSLRGYVLGWNTATRVCTYTVPDQNDPNLRHVYSGMIDPNPLTRYSSNPGSILNVWKRNLHLKSNHMPEEQGIFDIRNPR